jgi:hypothetical protein
MPLDVEDLHGALPDRFTAEHLARGHGFDRHGFSAVLALNGLLELVRTDFRRHATCSRLSIVPISSAAALQHGLAFLSATISRRHRVQWRQMALE